MKAILSLCLAVGALADVPTLSELPSGAAPRAGASGEVATTEAASTTSAVATTTFLQTTTTPTPTTTTAPKPVLFCPAGWCHDISWFPGSPCITPDPTVLGPCWDSYCKANVVFPTAVPTGSIIIDPGEDKGSYCKSWQIPAGRVCYGNDTVACQCDSFNSTAPVTALPGAEPSGWAPAVNCSYPQPTTTTTTLTPTWNPYDPNDPNNDNDGHGTPPVVPPQPSSSAYGLSDDARGFFITAVFTSLPILAVLLH